MDRRAPNAPSVLRDYLEAVLVAVLVALFAKTFVFEAFEIPSASMEKNLLVGDHIVVNKFVYGKHDGPWARLLPHRDVARGDVVVFRYPVDPSRDFVKRIVGLSGDVLRSSRKALVRNGEPLDEPYALVNEPEPAGSDLPESIARRDEFGPFTVPAGQLFAMGDNRDNSQDSRFWGPVPWTHVRGRALLVYWSVEPPPRVFTGRGAGLRRLLDTAVHFSERTRWLRTFRVVR